jgi:phage terminase large subunit-like protein
MSLAQKVALLPPESREKILEGIDQSMLRFDWSFWGRPSQLLPDDDSWHVAIAIAGRGWGKTLTGNQWVRHKAMSSPGSRGFLVARTASDVRDTLVMGQSGILAVHPPSEMPEWSPANRRLTWPNGSTALAISADNPDLLRGPQAAWSLCVPGDTSVSTPDGPRRMDSLRPGDTVHDRNFAPALVTAAAQTSPAAETVVVRTDSGHTLIATPDHLVHTGNRGWVRARDLVPGTDEVLTTGAPASVVSLSARTAPVPVHDIATTSGEFFANGVLVHNCDEIATWDQEADSSGLTAWNNVLIATRLGANPQVVALTTPKNTPFMRDLIETARNEPRWILRTGSTYENAGNLSRTYLDQITGMYEGTALARQELHGEMFDGQLEGTLWMPGDIEPNRVDAVPDSPLVHVVGVDPSVAERPRDECGIVVAAATMERSSYARNYYVLQDASLRASPSSWARIAAETARRFSAPIVAEVNQGGALVREAIMSTDPSVRVLEVRATQSKRTRAEPVALLYQQRRVHHVGAFPALEEQMTLWQPETTKRSPDRVDALVWAISALSQGTKRGSLIAPRVRTANPRAPMARLPSASPMNTYSLQKRRRPPFPRPE